MRRKEDRTTQILALLVQEIWVSLKSQSARIWTPWKHRA